MLVQLQFLGTPPTPLPLATRKHSSIENAQSPAPGVQCINQHRGLLAAHPSWAERVPPVGVYNCAGHVWASRRTSITDDKLYLLILGDDGYREVHKLSEVLPDDIAVYKLAGTERILHVAKVNENRVIAGTSLAAPFVTSKLGPTGGEVIHRWDDYPGIRQYSVSFWTDRP